MGEERRERRGRRGWLSDGWEVVREWAELILGGVVHFSSAKLIFSSIRLTSVG